MERRWKKQLETQSGILNLPSDFQRKSVRELNGEAVEFRADEELFNAIQVFCNQHAVDKETLLLSAWLVLLFKHSNQTDITTGVSFPNPDPDPNKASIELLFTLVLKMLDGIYRSAEAGKSVTI